jgi:hypothetical protein
MEMHVTRIDRWLAGGLVISVTLAVAAVAAGRMANRPQQSYRVGDRFDLLSNEAKASSGPRLVLWLDSRCHYCTASTELYRAIMDLKIRPRTVVLGREPEDVIRSYLVRYGIKPDYLQANITQERLFRGTPTLLLLDDDGVVRASWVGELTPAQSKEMLDRLATAAEAEK